VDEVVLLPDPLVFCVVDEELDVGCYPCWLDGREIDADDVGFFVCAWLGLILKAVGEVGIGYRV
jgi:hypothetical protein